MAVNTGHLTRVNTLLWAEEEPVGNTYIYEGCWSPVWLVTSAVRR
jgi:hypothetical protein